MKFQRAMLSVVVAVLSLALQTLPTEAQSNLAYAVKANYLVRFTAFVVWPPHAFATAQAPVVICVAGRDPFGSSLESAARGQGAHGRPLEVRRLQTASAVTGCHILYVGQGGGPAIEAAAGKPVLVVTDQGVSGATGTLHFVVADARVRFHIDRLRAERSGLEISSRLLNLAVNVERRG